MLELRRKERDSIRVLERRLAHLEKRLTEAPDKTMNYLLQERKALLWALEVIEHAVATNCHEAFAYTNLRAPADRDAKRTADYLERSAEREKDRAAKAEAKSPDQESVGENQTES